jgi:hypothetical protein
MLIEAKLIVTPEEILEIASSNVETPIKEDYVLAKVRLGQDKTAWCTIDRGEIAPLLFPPVYSKASA